MKNLLALVLIICLPVIAYFQYSNYRRMNPPASYAPAAATDIDLNYHDAGQLAAYYHTLSEAGHFGRHCWKEYRLDVKSDKPADPFKQNLVNTYQQLLARAAQLEALLRRSAALKARGLDNENIRRLEQEGLSEGGMKARLLLDGKTALVIGEKGAAVFEAQKLLKATGCELPIDGVFDIVTEGCVRQFQQAKNLYPSGKLDLHTLSLLAAP